ncbi:MAG TPA: sialidase family protein [Bryobacteraceae bacterium]|nr:sialidase family protein [Bryobacteraceae bacterium]
MIRIALSLLVAAFPVAGQIQSSVFDPSGNSYISALRADPNGDLIIAGTANGSGLPLVNAFQSRFASSGMEITRNGGRTWQMGQTPAVKDSLLKLVVDPTDANTVYALGNFGVYRSKDATQTWQTLTSYAFDDFVIDPQNPSTIYAYNAAKPLFLKSTDGGATWAVQNFPPADTSGNPYPNPALTLNPFRSGTVYLNTYHGLYRSTDGGNTWTTVPLPGPASGGAVLLFDPNTPGLVYLRAGGSFPFAIWWRSEDNMATWVRLPQPNLQYLALDPIHAGVLYAEDVSGYAIKSEDFGDTWKQLALVNGTGPYAIIPGTPPTLIYSVKASYDGGATWTSSPFPLTPGNGASTLTYAPSAPGVAYYVTSAGSNAFVARLDSSGQQIRFSTLLGGPGGAAGTAVATDASGNTYLGGNTSDSDFPTTPGAAQTAIAPGYPFQGFLAKFDPGGTLLWSTLLPTEVSSMAVDAEGSVVFLWQWSIHRVSPNGDRIDAITSSALTDNSFLTRVALAPNGNIAVAGERWTGLGIGGPVYLIWMDPLGNTISKTTFASSSVSAVEVERRHRGRHAFRSGRHAWRLAERASRRMSNRPQRLCGVCRPHLAGG